MILAIRTDKPESELYLFNELKEVDKEIWQAQRELSDVLLTKIETLLTRNSLSQQDLSAILAYTGPGSFTGLRIGISVANSLAYALGIPVVGSNQENWLNEGLKMIKSFKKDPKKMNIVIPEYGAAPNITKPRK